MLTTFLYFLLTIFIIVSVVLYIYKSFPKIYMFRKYEEELRYYLDEAYSILYAEDIIVYVKSSVTLDTKDQEYISLLNKLISTFKLRVGSRYKFYSKLLGGEENLIDYINLYFNQRVYLDLLKHVAVTAIKGGSDE